MLRPVVVATAAPVTPSRGKGPIPKIRHGSRQMLQMFAIQSTRIAIAASPAPRKTALTRKSNTMTPFMPRRIVVNEACARTPGVAPMSASSGRANHAPKIPEGIAMSTPSAIAWTAARAAPSRSRSPTRLAMVAVAPTLNPASAAYMIVSIDSVSPTVATASAPRRPTKNTSTTANTDSSTSSSTIGTASRRIARSTGPSVYSACEPRTASRIVAHAPGSVET